MAEGECQHATSFVIHETLVHQSMLTFKTSNAGLMLGQHQRHWPNMKPALVLIFKMSPSTTDTLVQRTQRSLTSETEARRLSGVFCSEQIR